MSFPKVTTISLMEEGYKVVRTKKDGLSVEKRGRVIKFDIRVETPRGYCGVHTFDDLKIKEKSLQE